MSDTDRKIDEILKIGLATEVNGHKFYKGFAERVTREETRDKINTLADDEIKHREVLEKIYRDYFKKDPDNLPEKGLGIFEKALEGHRVTTDITAPALLDIAIEAESASRDFYMDGEKSAESQELKEIFRRLADEEDGHFNLLTAEKNALAGLDWFAIGASGDFEY
ncbi:MAG: hypothetical protein GF307_02685 [candidate division Zixibacteria bacterium]|nr:hypothetical protein [candidate division Zixibacteria bacterium]